MSERDDTSAARQAGGEQTTARQAGGEQHSNEPLRAHERARAAGAAAEGDNHKSHTSAGDPAQVADPGADGKSDERAARNAAAAGASTDGGEAAEVEGDLDELMRLTAQRDEYLSLAQRTQADFENYKKRVAREARQAVERGISKLAKELLPALDNLDRAIAAAPSGDPLLEGVQLVRSDISAALARVGVESYSPAGERFDPTLHEAVSTLQQPEGGAASGTVVEVFQDGYRLGETIIRPARVVVAA